MTVNKLQHDKRRGKKDEAGEGVFISKIYTSWSFWLVCRWLRLVLEKTSDLLTLVFSVMKSHKTINPASYTTVQDVFPFLGLNNPRHMNYQDDSCLFFFYLHKNSRFLKSKQRCNLPRASRAALL